MLAAMLGSHSYYSVGPESQFFSKLSPDVLARATSDPHWPALAVQSLGELRLAGQPVVELFDLQPAEVEHYLRSREPSVQAMLESLTISRANRHDKPGWAEKTPNHLLNLEAIRSLWPMAKIVRIIRDPRDSALSSCNLPAFSNSFVANIYMWRSWQDAARAFLETDGGSFTIRYESLVEQPALELQGLCRFLDIPYEEEMISFSGAAGAVSSPAETWKKPVAQGLSRDRMFAWKGKLSPDEQALANDVTHEYLEQFDYERQPPATETRRVFRMSRAFVERHEDFLLRLGRRGIRWLPAASPGQADIIAEQPEYRRSRNPLFLARIALTWAKMKIAR